MNSYLESNPQSFVNDDNSTSQTHAYDYNNQCDDSDLIAAQESIQLATIILVNFEFHTKFGMTDVKITKQAEKGYKGILGLYNKKVQKISQEIDAAFCNPCKEEFENLKKEAHNLLKSLEAEPLVVQSMLSQAKSQIYSRLLQTTDIEQQKERFAYECSQQKEQVTEVARRLKLDPKDMLQPAEWMIKEASPAFSKKTESTRASEEENKEETFFYNHSSTQSDGPLTEHDTTSNDLDFSFPSTVPPSLNSSISIPPTDLSVFHPNSSPKKAASQPAGDKKETTEVDPRDKEQDVHELKVGIVKSYSVTEEEKEQIFWLMEKCEKRVGALRLDNVPVDSGLVKGFLRERFPEYVRGLYFNDNSGSLKSIEEYINELLYVSTKVKHRIFVYNYIINQENFKNILSENRHKERIGFPFCKIDCSTVPDLKDALEGTIIEQISFKGCGISARCNWGRNPHHFINLIQGLASSKDLKDSLHTIWLPMSFLSFGIVRETLNNNGFGKVKIGENSL
ncbi:unnamed protein product [Moneuplotes crassus]|uniref:Uncharacterized protein n=1 Tax=Euplotes crassus TaxID=5936 RepID=A0AAD1Y0V5_EUPCR|nr:unnamed protein product [Moneuplotes crassus]